MWLTVLLALALSFDCLGVGFSYGLQKIELPWCGSLIICGCSGAVLAASMCLGGLLGQWIPSGAVRILGAALIAGLGVWLLGKSVQESARREDGDAALFRWEIRRLGIIVQILREPRSADLDCSGKISGREALWLGLALSLDSCGAGVGLAMLGCDPWRTSLCAAASAWLLLCLGLWLGGRAGERLSYDKIKLLPGCLLIAIGILQLAAW